MIKREGEEVNGTDAKKRKVLDELSEDGPLTQQDVVYYQKEAIMRKLQQYKEEASIARTESQILSKDFETYKARLVTLNTWIEQFLEFVASLVPGAGSSDLDLLLEVPDVLEDDDHLAALTSVKLKLSEMVSSIAKNAPSDVSESLAVINKEFMNVKAKYTSLKSNHGILTKKYNSLSTEYQKLFKDHQRLHSKTIPRVLGQHEETPELQERQNSTTSADAIAKSNETISTPTTSPAIVNEDHLQSLQAEIDECRSVIEAQKTTIEENLERFQRLSTHLPSSSESTQTLESIQSSDAYKLLQKQYGELTSKHGEYTDRISALENELKESKDQIDTREASLKVFNEEKAKLEKVLHDTKEKEERLRNERDKAITEGEVWKQKNSLKVLDDLQELVKAQEAQIKNYDLTQKLEEVVPSELTDIHALQKKNGLLLAEVKELDAAFKQLQSVRVPKVMSASEEEKRKKELDTMRVKVDHKYRTLMQGEHYQKVNGEKLENSFKVLKTAFEKIESQQIEYKKQIDLLNSELANQKALLVHKEFETKEFSQKCTQLEETVKQEAIQAKTAQQDFSTIKSEYTTLLQKDSERAQELASLKSKVASQEKTILRFKTTGSVEDASEVDSFRSLIYCSLCSKNWKNTAIKTCGHVFCDSCAKERLAARMRKCPSCNKQFSTNDLLTIHL